MKVKLPIALLFVISTRLYGQNEPSAIPPKDIRFINQIFKDGYIVFQNGKRTETAKFNYDLFSRAIVFIGKKNDTLSIEDDTNVKDLIIDSCVYHHVPNRGFFEVIAPDTFLVLARQHKLIARKNTRAIDEGYGGTSNGTSSTLDASRNARYFFSRQTRFYILKRDGELIEATRVGFLKAFSKKEKILSEYIKTERIRFNHMEDVLRLFKFAIQIV